MKGHPTLFGMNIPSLRALDRAEARIEVRPAIVGTFADWAHSPDFPRELAARVNARGAVPLIAWEPWDSWRGGGDQPAYALARIADGDHDALLDHWAAQVAAYRRPVMFRFAAGMNAGRLPWSTGVNGNARGDYVAAWRHVRERFRRAGNAIWIWTAGVYRDDAAPLDELFPGEVDWVAVDGYNRDGTPYGELFGPTLRELGRLAPRRPVMIAETGCAPGPGKAAWITDTLQAARADAVDAVVWFEFDKGTDWRLSATAAAAGAARAALRTPAWLQGGDLPGIERAVRR